MIIDMREKAGQSNQIDFYNHEKMTRDDPVVV